MTLHDWPELTREAQSLEERLPGMEGLARLVAMLRRIAENGVPRPPGLLGIDLDVLFEQARRLAALDAHEDPLFAQAHAELVELAARMRELAEGALAREGYDILLHADEACRVEVPDAPLFHLADEPVVSDVTLWARCSKIVPGEARHVAEGAVFILEEGRSVIVHDRSGPEGHVCPVLIEAGRGGAVLHGPVTLGPSGADPGALASLRALARAGAAAADTQRRRKWTEMDDCHDMHSLGGVCWGVVAPLSFAFSLFMAYLEGKAGPLAWMLAACFLLLPLAFGGFHVAKALLMHRMARSERARAPAGLDGPVLVERATRLLGDIRYELPHAPSGDIVQAVSLCMQLDQAIRAGVPAAFASVPPPVLLPGRTDAGTQKRRTAQWQPIPV